MFIGDKTKKTVRILVQFRPGSILRSDGTPLPIIRDGTIANLVLPASTLADEAERQKLEEESTLELLQAGTSVFIGLNPTGVTSEDRDRLTLASEFRFDHEPKAPNVPSGIPQAPRTLIGRGYDSFAEVVLKEPLILRIRGDKKPSLEECKCCIPVLRTEARSLNHAFTLLSVAFETKRISHTGNVFARGFCRCAKSKDWRSLNELRGHI
jgi:hypothetical protein